MSLAIRPLPAAILCMGLLTASKGIGLVQHVGVGAPARANTAEPAPKPAESKPPAPVPADVKPPDASPPEPPVSESERALLQELRQRRHQLDDRAAKLDAREALLSAAETRLNERIQQLTALQTKLEGLEKERHDREEANWTSLVKTYEAMKPRDAAAIFNELDNGILVQVLDRMKEKNAAAVLAAMSPERARLATKLLAQFRTQTTEPPRLDVSAGGRQ